MSGAAVQIEINTQQLKDIMDRIAGRMADMTPVFREIGEVVQESVQRNFEEHRAPDGTKWAPLSAGTVKARAKKGRNAEHILILNRILMGSIHPEAGADRVAVGTDMIYGAIHQFGGLAGRGHSADIPARPYLGIRDEDWPEIRAAVETYITGG